ncbi:MAG TPA: ABC transporter permease, partial [Nocardioidaceae bacterium]|nr:ABC transporter permease [Nocardioidaceae bacterium]
QEAGEFRVEFDSYDDRAEVRDAVEQGDATAGLVDDTLFTSSQADGTFPVLVAQAVVALETSTRLSEAGLTPVQVARVQDVQPPEQVPVSQVADEGRAGVGFAVGIVLYLALAFAGSAISTTVAMEKSTRISEVLLAVLRPSQALVGTVLAVGAVTLLQLIVLAVPTAVAVRLTDAIGLPAVATGDLALALVWFVLGFALYAFLFAASAALVDKITEANSATLPVMTVLIVAYLLSVTMVAADPSSVVSVVASIFPLTAPVSMPIRWASGDVPVYQLVAAMVLTALTAVVLVRLAAAIYSRALLITGRRARWREVLR